LVCPKVLGSNELQRRFGFGFPLLLRKRCCKTSWRPFPGEGEGDSWREVFSILQCLISTTSSVPFRSVSALRGAEPPASETTGSLIYMRPLYSRCEVRFQRKFLGHRASREETINRQKREVGWPDSLQPSVPPLHANLAEKTGETDGARALFFSFLPDRVWLSKDWECCQTATRSANPKSF
jgi:hypothetical protein